MLLLYIIYPIREYSVPMSMNETNLKGEHCQGTNFFDCNFKLISNDTIKYTVLSVHEIYCTSHYLHKQLNMSAETDEAGWSS